MAWADLPRSRQVGYGPRQLEHTVVAAGGKLQLVHGGAHQGAAGLVQLAVLAHLGRVHVSVARHGFG